MIDKEKVARAIGGADVGADMMDLTRRWFDGGAPRSQPWPEHYARHADAAIAAVLEQLREPSEAMLAAGAIARCGYDTENEMAEMRDCWHAMFNELFPTAPDSHIPVE